MAHSNIPVKWALPGKERQDSVLSGFKETEADALLVAIHDSARPLVTAEDLRCRALAWPCIVALLLHLCVMDDNATDIVATPSP
jgi:2-C-methyl-D-erythritol 4-phosphate cytidylyltransferase